MELFTLKNKKGEFYIEVNLDIRWWSLPISILFEAWNKEYKNIAIYFLCFTVTFEITPRLIGGGYISVEANRKSK